MVKEGERVGRVRVVPVAVASGMVTVSDVDRELVGISHDGDLVPVAVGRESVGEAVRLWEGRVIVRVSDAVKPCVGRVVVAVLVPVGSVTVRIRVAESVSVTVGVSDCVVVAVGSSTVFVADSVNDVLPVVVIPFVSLALGNVADLVLDGIEKVAVAVWVAIAPPRLRARGRMNIHLLISPASLSRQPAPLCQKSTET
eukprot:Hpha_TRINITY_DN16294_c2_g5::TRINITY_DN16294_c2_g5_i1::g.12342::m.12342